MEADLLLHVVDAASPALHEQRATVMGVLRSLGVSETALASRMVEVFNKADLLRACDEAVLLGGGHPEANPGASSPDPGPSSDRIAPEEPSASLPDASPSTSGTGFAAEVAQVAHAAEQALPSAQADVEARLPGGGGPWDDCGERGWLHGRPPREESGERGLAEAASSVCGERAHPGTPRKGDPRSEQGERRGAQGVGAAPPRVYTSTVTRTGLAELLQEIDRKARRLPT